MPIAPSEFWLRLVDSGLTDQHGCSKFAEACSRQSPDSSLDSPTIAAMLIREGVLTKFQAKQLLGDPAPTLRLGHFVLRDDTPVRPLTHWLAVQTAVAPTEAAGESTPSRQGFLLRAPLSALDEARRSWLAFHSELRHPALQPIELSGGAQSENTEQIVEIFSPLPTGAPLWGVLKSKPKLSLRKTVRLGVDVAEALQTIHNAPNGGIVHGAIGADHVWVTSKGNAVLLRDPSSPARSPLADLSASWIERIEPSAQYAAPELSDPNTAPTVASDIYSLGCLLLTVLTGKQPFSGETNEALFASHRDTTPTELAEAIAQGASGDPVLRVLAYAMAKDPAARFDSAATFATALQRAAEVSTAAKKQPAARTPAPTPEPVASELQKPEPSTLKPPNLKPSPTATPTAQPEEKPEPAPPPTVAKPKAVKKRVVKQASKPVDKPTTEPKPTPIAPAPEAAPTPDVAPAAEPISAAKPTAEITEPVAIDAEPVSVAAEPATLPETKTDNTPSTPASHVRRRRRRNKNRVPILAGMMVVPLVLLGLAIMLRGRGPQPKPTPSPRPRITQSIPKVGEARTEPTVDSGPKLVRGFEIVDNDRLLWVPPYDAKSSSPSLELLPPGPAIIAKISVAKLTATDSPLRDAFGEELDAMLSYMADRSGVPADSIDQCVMGFFPGSSGYPRTAMVIKLAEPTPIATLLEQWDAIETRSGEQVLYADEDLKNAYYIGGGENGKLPEGQDVTRFVAGTMEQIREVADNAGGGIPLPRNLQTLWSQASEQSDMVVLATPNFLFADGRELINRSVPELRQSLKNWLIPDVAAFQLSLTVEADSSYVELREVPAGGASQATLLRDLRDTMQAWPSWADKFLLDTIPDRSWRVLASRLPLMLRFVSDQTRSSIDGSTVIASAYLPTNAAKQVSLATLLAMNTPPGESAANGTAGNETQELTIDELLDRPMSISFLQLSLQFSIDAVADEFRQDLPKGSAVPTFKIVGGDLELNGITQNQQIRNFDKEDTKLRQVLTDIVRAANPDPTATSPKDPKQALIWVVHPTGKPAAESEILITTRDAAKKKNYQLPAEFQIDP
ncbi:serine/threonine protein kinase [Rhodopirellula sp. MGV]|uniref:serine/threonine protein kinase n=1 Tax=Rhodopirellula sp. MGV TaxID=2023130 RepID=UPI000B971EB7|nr:protein kinase [Rhodopirellula sp. MGV]OYP36503.1 hypothetical protein CGZ80_08225 [Rhodopirellula sp. MGV]PNY37856.1 hypothetical protein C2E31_04945 [Rhodopirellula baltica]